MFCMLCVSAISCNTHTHIYSLISCGCVARVCDVVVFLVSCQQKEDEEGEEQQGEEIKHMKKKKTKNQEKEEEEELSEN